MFKVVIEDNIKYLACTEDLVLNAFSKNMFNTQIKFSTRKEEILFFKDKVFSDDIFVSSGVFSNEKDKELKITIINISDAQVVIPADTKLVKVESLTAYDESKNYISGNKIYDQNGIEVYNENEELVVASVEMLETEDHKPTVIQINFKDK